MSNNLFLLTGATGFLGFRVLREALETGYNVRAAVRSASKGNIVKSHPLIQKHKDQLTFITVPDFLAEGAFDEAVKDVNYIIHVASPLPFNVPFGETDWDKHFIQPAIRGTIGVLESAQKAGTVERIVITSSVLAIQPMKAGFMTAVDETFTAESRLPDPKGPYPNHGFAYGASKVAALNQAERWVKTQKPAFDVIHIHPSFIFGRDDLAKKPGDYETTSNRLIVLPALKRASPGETAPNNYTDVHVVAKLHVLALDPKIPGNQSFVTSSSGIDGMRFDQIETIIRKRFPEALEKGLLLNGDKGAVTTIVSKFDASKTEKTFGMKPSSHEDDIVEVIGHYLELLEQECSPRSPL